MSGPIPDSANSLGGVVLPVQGVWTDRGQWSPVGMATRRPLSGSLHVYYAGLSGGRPITLSYQPPLSWLLPATVDALRVLADVPGATYTLTWLGADYTVMFNHAQPPALNVELYTGAGGVIPSGHADDPDRLHYAAVINLIEV